MAGRSPIQTAAILICLTGERGDNLPLQPITRGRGGGVRKQGAKAKSKGRTTELNSDKVVGGVERESERGERERETLERRVSYLIMAQGLCVYPKAKDCQPANRGGACLCLWVIATST